MLLLRDLWREARGPAWRPVRWGLAALLGLNILALNVWAWRLAGAETARRQAMTTLLRETHPQVRAVLDAPAQMRRETDMLRSGAGRAGEGDLEPLMAAAAAAWPEGQPPVQTLRYEPGQLTLAVSGWSDAQAAAFRERVKGAGYVAETTPTQVVIKRG
jgi:general secretion pathway protein L